MKIIVDNDVLNMPDRFRMTDEEFFDFASQMDEKRIERDSNGNILIMPPVGIETGEFEMNAAFALKVWALAHGGKVYGSNTGFTLPNGAVRSPDAAWISEARYASLPAADTKKFGRICPDLVIEIKSASDHLLQLQEKMSEYIENGARLGFLIDPGNGHAFVYRPGQAPQEVSDFSLALSGEEVMPGFELPLSLFVSKG